MIRFPEHDAQFDLPAGYGRGIFNDLPCVATADGSAGWAFQRIVAAQDNGSLAEVCRLAKQATPVGRYAGLLEQDDDPQLTAFAQNPFTQDILFLACIKGALTGERRKAICRTILAGLQFINPTMARWDRTLRGSVLLSADGYKRAYGSGDGYSSEARYRFHTDDTYELVVSTHISVSGPGGLGASRTSQQRESGTWAIVDVGGESQLQLVDDRERTTHLTLSQSTGSILLDGQRFAVGG